MWFYSNVVIYVDQIVRLTSWDLLILKITLITKPETKDRGHACAQRVFAKCISVVPLTIDRLDGFIDWLKNWKQKPFNPIGI